MFNKVLLKLFVILLKYLVKTLLKILNYYFTIFHYQSKKNLFCILKIFKLNENIYLEKVLEINIFFYIKVIYGVFKKTCQ